MYPKRRKYYPHVHGAKIQEQNQQEYARNHHGVNSGRSVRLTSQPSVIRLSRKCGSLDVSQPHVPLRPVTGTVFPFLPFAKNNFNYFYKISEEVTWTEIRVYHRCNTGQIFLLYRVFTAQADWTLTHTSHTDTEQMTIEASITLDGVTRTDSLIRWSPNEWLLVCREIPGSPIRFIIIIIIIY
jgi:hypothetical protein